MRGSDCAVRPILCRNWLFGVRAKASRSPSDQSHSQGAGGSLEPDRHPRPEGRRCRVYSAGITHRHEAIVHEPRPASISPPPSRSFATLSAMPPSQPTSWDQLSRAACVPTATSTSSSSAPIVDSGRGYWDHPAAPPDLRTRCDGRPTPLNRAHPRRAAVSLLDGKGAQPGALTARHEPLPTAAPSAVEATATPVAMPAVEVPAASKRERDCGSISVGRIIPAVVRIIVVGVAPIASPRAMPMPTMAPTAAMAVTTIVNRFGV